MNDSFEQIGKGIADQLDHFPEAGQILKSGRVRFEEHLHSENGTSVWSTRRRSLVLVAGLVLCGAILMGGSLRSWYARQPISVTVEADPSPALGRWVIAKQETKQLRFSDGTRLSLHPDTHLRVEATRKSGATVRLGGGRALAQVAPKRNATWRFMAGPFTVQVTGTEFDLAWSPETGVLELALHEGSVTVSGPSLTPAKVVQRGEFLRLTAPAPNEGRSSPAGELVEPSRLGEDSPEQSDLAPRSPAERASRSEERGPRTWNSLLAEGKQEQALVLLLSEGKDKAFAAATSQELWAVTQAARMGGQPRLAVDALLALRNKHGSRGESAYLLGKIQADQLHATSEAVSWFEAYLKEAPSGALAEQALGRLVELQAGTRRGAQTAKEYLRRFPRGPHAKFARSLLH